MPIDRFGKNQSSLNCSYGMLYSIHFVLDIVFNRYQSATSLIKLTSLKKHIFLVHFTPMHILVRVTGQFGWIIWIAKVMKVKYRIVDPTDGENTTVVTVKMQGYNVVSVIHVEFNLLDFWLSYMCTCERSSQIFGKTKYLIITNLI